MSVKKKYLDPNNLFYSTRTRAKPLAIGVDSANAFQHFIGSTDLSKKFYDILKEMTASVRAEADSLGLKVSGGALNNVRGKWYEWLALKCLWEAIQNASNNELAIFQLPSKAGFELQKIFGDRAQAPLSALVADLARNGTSLESSNPDAIVLRVPPELRASIPSTVSHQQLAEASDLASLLSTCLSLMDWEDLVAIISLKASLRPDRRHQSVLEANRVKALHYHLMQRMWVREAALFAYTLTPKHSREDENAAKTALTYTITHIDLVPRRSTDRLMNLADCADADTVAAELVKDLTGTTPRKKGSD